MSLTPVDIIHTKFNTAFSGYKKFEVDSFVEEARKSLEQLIQEKSELQRECAQLKDEVQRVKAIEATLSEVLTTAQAVAEDLKANAHKQAENILAEAEIGRVKIVTETQQCVEKSRAEIALLEHTKDMFESELRGLITGYLEMLDRMKSANQGKADVA